MDATLIAAPCSTKNTDGKRDPEMHLSKKGNQWHFGMKAHIGVDADVFANAGYQGADRRPDANPSVRWHVAMRPGKRKRLDKANSPIDALIDKVEKLKLSIRAKVEHPFRAVKRQFGHVKVRYRG